MSLFVVCKSALHGQQFPCQTGKGNRMKHLQIYQGLPVWRMCFNFAFLILMRRIYSLFSSKYVIISFLRILSIILQRINVAVRLVCICWLGFWYFFFFFQLSEPAAWDVFSFFIGPSNYDLDEKVNWGRLAHLLWGWIGQRSLLDKMVQVVP